MTDIFLITSVIQISTNPWSYTPIRSVFSPEERFKQTLETIASIRTFHPTAKILLCECSNLDETHTKILIEKTDYFIQNYSDEKIRTICLGSIKKGQGESWLTWKAIQYIKENEIQFRRLFKISGRYQITQLFNASDYSDITFTFRTPFENSTAIPTFLYSVPFSLLRMYETVIQKCIDEYEHSNPGYEDLFPYLSNPRSFINKLGVTGRIAIDNYLIIG